jgi:hypothetical protein
LSTQEGRAQPFVEAWLGDYPVILSAPHGGYLAPDSLKDRTCSACVTVRDSRTQEWARYLTDEIFLLTGRRPYAVINLLARVKLDANRDLQEASDGDANSAEAWSTYHAALDQASADVSARYGAGLVLDLHGHGHSVPRFELGYLLSASTLRLPDSDLDGRSAGSSVLNLARGAGAFSALIRGPDSFGELLQTQGVAATPSLTDPAPGSGEAFFSGGYITRRHGSLNGGTVDGIQLEAFYPEARDSDSNVAQLAKRVAQAVVSYMERWYGDAVTTSVEKVPTHPASEHCLSSSTRLETVWFELSRECHPGEVEVRVSDVLGRLVGRMRIGGGERRRLDTGPLSAGIYFAVADGMPEAVRVVVR